MASLNAQRNLNRTQEQNAMSLQRLSSGLRINSAKDDAAGMAIATRFTSQIKGLNQAVRNAGDGIALAQTAEGALGSMEKNLQRIRELAVQSANASNSDIDREKLQKEVKQLIAEVGRTAEETNFNGRKLLDGKFKDAAFQVGANAGESINISIAALTADKIGSNAAAGVSAAGTNKALSNGDLTINGKLIGPSKGGDDTASVTRADQSGIAKAAAINEKTKESGVKAKVNVNEVNGSTMSATGGGTTASLKINGVKFTFTARANDDDVKRAGTRLSVVKAINAKSDQTGVVAVDGGDKNGVILQAKDGRNIVLSDATAAGGGNLKTAFGLAAVSTQTLVNLQASTSDAGIYTAGVTLTAIGDTKEIKISGGYGTGSGDLSKSGFSRGSYQKGEATYTTKTTAVSAGAAATAGTAARLKGLQAGDLVINSTTISTSSSEDDQASDTTAHSSNAGASGIAVAAAINRASEQTGVKAEVQATIVSGGAKATAAATEGTSLSIYINNTSIGKVVSQGDLQKDRVATIDAINAKSGQTGVVASDNGESITLTAADGRNISVGVGGTGAAAAVEGLSQKFGLHSKGDKNGIGVTTAASTYASTAETTYSAVRLTAAKSIDIDAGDKGTKGLEDSGFARGEYGQGKDGQFLKDIDISTVEGARKAMNAITNAIETVSNQRADLGAVQNRMTSTVSNLRVNAENLTSAKSRVMDADFAAQTAELSRTSVLQQAGISILAQANAQGKQVLSLLG